MRKFLNIFIVLFLAIFLTGCSSLNYEGDDYNPNNLQSVKTNEDFAYSVYKKTLNDNVNIKIGISKTPVNEILSLYVQVENLSYETPYVFKVEDLRLSNSKKDIPFISTNTYLNIYQNQEASSMSSMSSMGSTLNNLTNMMNNYSYNNYNDSMAQTTNDETTKSMYSKMEELGNKILAHSIKVSSTVSPRKSQYYYFFFEDYDIFPIYVKYKNLDYAFNI